MYIERIGAQVVCRFTPEEALQLSSLAEEQYEQRINPEIDDGGLTIIDYDKCDLLWDVSKGLQDAAKE